MSSNADARPKSQTVGDLPRRTFLTAASAVLATGASAATVAAATASTDPVFALIEAERAAWDAFGTAIDVDAEAGEAVWAADLYRKPRVQVGTYTRFVDENSNPIPHDKLVERPFYAHTPAEIERSYGPPTAAARAQLSAEDFAFVCEDRAATRARLLAELEADKHLIETAPETQAKAAAEARRDAASAAQQDALLAVLNATPTTAAGLLAILALFEERELNFLDDPHDAQIAGLLAAVRSFVNGRV